MENNQTHKTSSPNYNKKLLEFLGVKPIAFNPLLAKATGSVKAGLLLSQFLYWWRKGKNPEWFYKTIEEAEEETALSRHEQDGAIDRLRKLNLIETELRDIPARRYFKLNLPEIGKLVCGGETNWFDENQQPITETTSEISSDTNANALQVAPVVEYGNKDINFLISYLKEKLSLPLLDGTVQQNRRYAYSLIRKFDGVDKVKLLIDATAQDDFWSTKITSFQQLFYKAVQIISKTRKRGGVFMTPQMSDKTYIVAYGYDQTFDLTENEAEALITAREKGSSAIRLNRGSLSTAYSWVMPKWEVESERLNEEELKLAEMTGKWLARPVHDLDFTPESAMRYAKKLVKRIGCGQVKRLWDVYANGAYPSAKKFLMEAKEVSSIQTTALPDET